MVILNWDIFLYFKHFSGLWLSRNFTIRVDNRNDPPTDITCIGMFGNQSLYMFESSASGTVLAACTPTDEDAQQMHFFSIIKIVAKGHGKTRYLSIYSIQS